MGVPLRELTYMFGDNYSVVNNSMTTHDRIHERHVALYFHRFRKSMLAKIIAYHFINGKTDPADVLSKHWANRSV